MGFTPRIRVHRRSSVAQNMPSLAQQLRSKPLWPRTNADNADRLKVQRSAGLIRVTKIATFASRTLFRCLLRRTFVPRPRRGTDHHEPSCAGPWRHCGQTRRWQLPRGSFGLDRKQSIETNFDYRESCGLPAACWLKSGRSGLGAPSPSPSASASTAFTGHHRVAGRDLEQRRVGLGA